jgi:exosome complex component RRP42
MQSLSEGERSYIIGGAAAGVRSDGRAPLQQRPVTLETGVLPTASGSARVRVGGVTDVLVGVTAVLAEPSPVAPSLGIVEFSVECSSLASPDFTGRGADDANAELAVLLARLYDCAGTEDMRRALCLIPGKKCWVLHVDTLVLDSGGSLFDAASLAVRAALRTALLPRVRVVPGEADDEDEVEVDEGALSGVEGAAGAPVAVTLTLLGRGDGRGVHVADASSDEAACAAAAVTVGVSGAGRACGVVSGGSGGIGLDALEALLHDARTLGVAVVAAVDEFVGEALRRREAGEAEQPVGFLA